MHQYTLCSDLSEMPVTTVALPGAPPWCVLGIKSRGRRMKCHGSLPQSWEPLGAVYRTSLGILGVIWSVGWTNRCFLPKKH